MRFDLGISGAIILSAANGYRPFTGSVGVKDGRIDAVLEGKIARSDCGTWIDGTDRILMPGLVNAHCHGDMTLARGLGDDLTLAEQNAAFAETNWFKTVITDDDRRDARRLTYCEALLSGTTFIMENMYWGLGGSSAEVMAETGIRGALAEDVRRDFSEPEILLPDEELLAIRRGCEERGLVPVLGCLSEEDFSESALRKVKAAAQRTGMRQTLHLAENTWRIERVRSMFGMGSVEFLDSLGALDAGVIGSHVIHVTPEEVRILARTGASVANTPICEMKIADGIAPITDMVRAGVNVCLGTDGAMWNNSSDIFREMKAMSLIQTARYGIRSLKTTEILDMATINGARAFGLEKEMGSIEEGKSADMILIRTDRPHMQPLRTGELENVSSCVVFCATGSDVTDVFVRGARVVEEGRLTSIDPSPVIRRLRETSDRIACEISKEKRGGRK